MNAPVRVGQGEHRGRAWRAPRLLVIIVAGSCLATSCGGRAAPAAGAPPVNSLTVKSCTVDGVAARCGTLIAPEDRLTGQGRTIPVRFVIFPAIGPDRQPDPVVYFAGGPGSSAIADIPSRLPDLLGLNLHRDLVFIEQRGTGQSGPLTCPAFPSTLTDKAALRADVRSCLAHLHGDLRFYTTAMFTDDASQILTDLHYSTVNLIGGSYGPTAEQVFLLRHPGQVRTMTMMNGTLLTIPLFEREPGNSQLALEYVFGLCESQPACHQAFPHLAADWSALWASLGTSPWVLPAAQSPTGQTARLDQGILSSWIFQALHASELAPIPVIVHTLGAAANGAATAKAAAVALVFKALLAAGLTGAGGGTTPMMQYEILCAEPWASLQPAALSDQRASFAYQTDLENAQWYQFVCPLIPKSAAAVGSQQLTVSRVPVLEFSGDADPADPAPNMAGARQFWPDSLDITLPGQGHVLTSDSWFCEGALIQAFMQQASVAHLDTGCVAAIPAPAFPLTVQALAAGG
jgi:pimeloyl-ACP methyl ester carboxylesterase